MPQSCTVLIASADLLPTLKEKTTGDAEMIAFTDADALRALEAITSRKPSLVALEKVFAATPRGAALINRIKADPALKQCEVLIVSPDMDFSRFARRPGAPHPPGAPLPSGPGSPPSGIAGKSAAAVAPAPAAPPSLDRGTRRAQRFKITGHVDVLVDGNPAVLVDISMVGAQVISASVLKPNQRIRIGLNDAKGDVRFRGAVAWASFEISPKGPRYRAGIEFLDANPAHVNAYISRHKTS